MSEETANSANSAENTDANLRIMQGGRSAEHWFKRYLAAQDRYEITLRRLREAEAERDALREALERIADSCSLPIRRELQRTIRDCARAALQGNFAAKSLNVKDNFGGAR